MSHPLEGLRGTANSYGNTGETIAQAIHCIICEKRIADPPPKRRMLGIYLQRKDMMDTCSFKCALEAVECFVLPKV